MRLFMPNITYNSFNDINIELLVSKGVKTLLVDVDNTLVAHDVALPTKENFEFVKKVHDAGLEMIIVSNNNKVRVKTFADKLELPFYSFSTKPLKRTYKKILKDLNPQTKIAVVGDQILTDVLGGNRMGFISIYTKPLVTKDISITKINRIFERKILKNLEKNNRLNIGEYYE